MKSLTACITERRKAVRKQIATTAISRPPKCHCHNCKGAIHRYKCHECLRVVPWCYGGSSEYEWENNACDMCWDIITDGGTIDVRDAKEAS